METFVVNTTQGADNFVKFNTTETSKGYTAKNLTYTGSGNKTINFTLPKESSTLSAELEVSGFTKFNYDNENHTVDLPEGLFQNSTGYWFVADDNNDQIDVYDSSWSSITSHDISSEVLRPRAVYFDGTK